MILFQENGVMTSHRKYNVSWQITPLYYTRIQYIKVVRDHTTYEKTEATVFNIVLLLYS